MMMYIYLGILLLILVFVIRYLFTENKLLSQIDAALVLIPMLLRLFLIK
ncbi:MAG TPA: hypothetical protein GX499_08445 [Clostridiales bacterium]|jgi:hypothetical protein|nr:hypothetical protein [Clostridiales bacterium]